METSFSLMNIFSGTLLWDVHGGTLEATTEYTYEVAVDPSDCYLFTIQDLGGDGIALYDGLFELYYGGLLVGAGQNFDSETAIVVGDGCQA